MQSIFLVFISILDADEDDQIAAAIKASLAESKKKGDKNNFDSDLSDEEVENDDYFDNVESFSAENSSSAFHLRNSSKDISKDNPEKGTVLIF